MHPFSSRLPFRFISGWQVSVPSSVNVSPMETHQIPSRNKLLSTSKSKINYLPHPILTAIPSTTMGLLGQIFRLNSPPKASNPHISQPVQQHPDPHRRGRDGKLLWIFTEWFTSKYQPLWYSDWIAKYGALWLYYVPRTELADTVRDHYIYTQQCNSATAQQRNSATQICIIAKPRFLLLQHHSMDIK